MPALTPYEKFVRAYCKAEGDLATAAREAGLTEDEAINFVCRPSFQDDADRQFAVSGGQATTGEAVVRVSRVLRTGSAPQVLDAAKILLGREEAEKNRSVLREIADRHQSLPAELLLGEVRRRLRERNGENIQNIIDVECEEVYAQLPSGSTEKPPT